LYEVKRNGKTILESDACGIGFLASRRGVAERRILDVALDIAKRYDHRGAPGHGAGVQFDIPWSLLLDRFSEHAKPIAQRDVVLGMFFLPFDAPLRRRCVEVVEELAGLASAPVLQWADVPVNPSALPPTSGALRTLPVVRQALFQRPKDLGEEGWFACRYLLRLALDRVLNEVAGDQFSITSLSNRTVVYKGLAQLSKIGELYPDLEDPQVASRYVLFHSRYCTNTTTAWRRAQPFWSVAHNGEISTIGGNVAWMKAIGGDLIRNLVERHPELTRIASQVSSIVCSGGSDTSNLDDMVIALIAGGMTYSQALLALLPGAASRLAENDPLRGFYKAASVYLGACDGPAAIVGCDGDQAVAHLDRNGLRPLWFVTTKDYAMAASELTGHVDLGSVETQRVMGPGETIAITLASGRILFDDAVAQEVTRNPFPSPESRMTEGQEHDAHIEIDSAELTKIQASFGMKREDIDVLIEPLKMTGKPALGSMGDDTAPAALLDRLPRRIEDYFKLRFAQETSPPVDPIRDEWVFDTTVVIGDRGGLWSYTGGPLYQFDSRMLSNGHLSWLKSQPGAKEISILFDACCGDEGIEAAITTIVGAAVQAARESSVLILTDRKPNAKLAPLPPIRVLSRLHQRLVELGLRNKVGLVADVGVWDIHHAALLVTLGTDAVCPWLGCASAGESEQKYLHGLRSGFLEAMSMMGVTPSSAYCGARLVEAIGLDAKLMAAEFPGVPLHLGGITADVLNREWFSFHREAFSEEMGEELVDAGEFRHSKSGRHHANNAEIVRSLHAASGFAKKIHGSVPGSWEAYKDYSSLVSKREPITILDCLTFRDGSKISIDEVESEESILWRFMAPGMSEGALSEPAHKAVAKGMNTLYRYCRMKFAQAGEPIPGGIGPVANTGEGGFDKKRIGTSEGNRSVQYAGGRFTITPMTAACADEAEVKFAQGAKPGKGGQLPGKKVSVKVAHQRGCEPGYELVSPPINHNLYSIEDVKLMIESWRHLNPKVNCALKYVATYGIEMVCVGGVNAGANRLHISDGCGGTGAAKRVDQKHAGIPVVAVLPTVQDLLIEEDVRHLVELSVDGGVQTGEQALKLFLLGADRVGFGTSLLIAIGCSMLRKCHMSGPDPSDPTGKRRLGCTPGIATQDPHWIAKFAGDSKHIARMLRFAAREVREQMAELGIRRLSEVIGRREMLVRKQDLSGKSALIDLRMIQNAPHGRVEKRNYAAQTAAHMPKQDERELAKAAEAILGQDVEITGSLTNERRCVGVEAAGQIARAYGDLGLPHGSIHFIHSGAAGHFYGAYAVDGMSFRLTGVAADSCFTAAYGGTLCLLPPKGLEGLALVGNAFGYGARGGTAYIAGKAGNRFGICLRKNHEGGGPRIVVEGVEANAFQYMTGGTALVLGRTGVNLGSGMTGGRVYLLDAEPTKLNTSYVHALQLDEEDASVVRQMLLDHADATQSKVAKRLLDKFDPSRFSKVVTVLRPEFVPEAVGALAEMLG